MFYSKLDHEFTRVHLLLMCVNSDPTRESRKDKYFDICYF